MKSKPKTAYDANPQADRRGFFGQLFRELARPIVEFQEGLKSGPEPAPIERTQVPLRPPGASDDIRFMDACDRSGECIAACPAKAILSDEGGYPVIHPQYTPCVVCMDLACMSVCPSGALAPKSATDLGMGVAQVDHIACLRSQGTECRLCVQSCPMHEHGVTVLEILANDRVHVYEDACVGCGCCVRACPTQPKAILVEPIRFRLSAGGS